jgi:hypothetical protein
MNLRIETQDLIGSCPIWNAEFMRAGNYRTPLHRRIFEFRKRWSWEVLTVCAPVKMNRIPPRDLHTSLQCLSHWRCQSQILWRVVGPPELLSDLRGNNGGNQLPWSQSLSIKEVVASAPLKLYLCQHEIRGD